MKKTSLDFIVGSSILIALFILIFGVLWLKEVSIAQKMETYTIMFPNIGALQVGDPVMVSGVKMGSVGEVNLEDAQVAVTIKIDKSITITDSAKAIVQNIGLMGERNIGIQLSEKGTIVEPNDKDGTPSQYLQGYFDSGIAEAMGMLGNVLTDVQMLVGNVQQIVDQTVGDSTFIDFFYQVIGRVDTVTYLVQDLIESNGASIDQSVENIKVITTDIKSLIDDNRNQIASIIDNGELLTDEALEITSDIDSMTASLQSMISSIESGEGSLGMLIEDEEFYTDLKSTMGELDSLIGDVQDRGLKLRIKLGFKEKR